MKSSPTFKFSWFYVYVWLTLSIQESNCGVWILRPLKKKNWILWRKQSSTSITIYTTFISLLKLCTANSWSIFTVLPGYALCMKVAFSAWQTIFTVWFPWERKIFYVFCVYVCFEIRWHFSQRRPTSLPSQFPISFADAIVS